MFHSIPNRSALIDDLMAAANRPAWNTLPRPPPRRPRELYPVRCRPAPQGPRPRRGEVVD